MVSIMDVIMLASVMAGVGSHHCATRIQLTGRDLTTQLTHIFSGYLRFPVKTCWVVVSPDDFAKAFLGW